MSEFLEADVVKKMEEVKILYRKLDELSITILRTLQSIMFERKYLDANLQEGYINMAKARYLMRGQKVGIHQVNSTNLTATFKNDATLKLRSVNVENQLVDDQVSVLAPDEVDCKNEDSKTSKETICSNYNDPLKWFGVLVPESLRTCQTRFKQSTCTALKIISLHNKLRELHKEYKILKLQKASLCSHDLICNNTESECNNSVKS
ncbi:Coiled-coil domain-containing protein 115 [Argiope bruennichi]|uniref:Vacuolar ATPase assembly protein VMA22 n=1 Tax=Argiope bruennichi TaxID=94029 RepID=A0A8T0FNB9_ARGBR|nr:Coiled-coil domain-containing protein 115 [Argiope bruennichi]